MRKAEKDTKKRGVLAGQIAAKATSTKEFLIAVMHRPSYATLPATNKSRIEEFFRKADRVETQAVACVRDNSKPLPEEGQSMAEMMVLHKNAKAEESKILKILVVMDRALSV